ncbi:MAG: phage tail protein [Cyanobacteriota bacterium]|nr:phage tail protein [Cyanobacteriota bacterium]
MTHRFGVFFFHAGMVFNPLDIRFQEVTGLGAKIQTSSDPTAAPTLSAAKMPTGIDYDNLVLKRGVVTGSPVAKQVESMFRNFRFHRSDVLVTTFAEEGIPTGGWLFSEAFPVEWQLADLTAQTEAVLVETLSLSYARLRWMTL